MLIDASDYTYNAANIATDAVTIEGRIIPTEDINGQPHPLRRENLAYLSEAISERLGAAYWSCPAKNAPLSRSMPEAVWSEIRSIYASNVPQTTTMGTRGFVRPDQEFFDVVSDSDQRIYETYKNLLLSAADLPIGMGWEYPPYSIYADDMRTMFYFVNLLRRKWMEEQIPSGGSLRYVYGKNTGAATLDAVLFDNNAPDKSEKLPVHDSTSNQGFTDGYLLVEGSVIGGSGDPQHYGYRMYGNDLYDYSQAYVYGGTYLDGSEFYYVGDVELKYDGRAQKCGSEEPPLLFVEFRVFGLVNGATRQTKYLWRPISNATFVRDADGNVTSVKFPVDKAYLRQIVQIAFPQAYFDYDTIRTANTVWSVQTNNWKILEFPDYKSLLPEEWTFSPT